MVLIPILIEIRLIISIATGHRYSKFAIYLWVVICFIIGCGFEAIADLLDGVSTNNFNSLLFNMLGLLVGILIIDFTRRMVTVK